MKILSKVKVVPALQVLPSVKVNPSALIPLHYTRVTAKFLSSFALFLARIGMSRRFTVPFTFLAQYLGMILMLLTIDLSILYFKAACKALDSEILVSSSSPGLR